ncbi:Protein plastid movement impaired 1-related 1 [Quillaja saponaria]|uniref:Protein plastid movement impaired 1-related 1 n=1 Tax=Quillaja saponaria TaxID=32244 RepID=A0AAD7KVL4_QUISA|nr:Protein plastid movement impaired 1-related 1 [Quillaja saponaria]
MTHSRQHTDSRIVKERVVLPQSNQNPKYPDKLQAKDCADKALNVEKCLLQADLANMHMVSAGVENLVQNTCKLMPLEEIARKTMQLNAMDNTPSIVINDRDRIYGCMNCCLERTHYVGKDFEELDPRVMNEIEALLMEGLRIQSDMLKMFAFGGRRINAGELFLPSLCPPVFLIMKYKEWE